MDFMQGIKDTILIGTLIVLFIIGYANKNDECKLRLK